MRDHGGNLDWAMARWGGAADDWVDLSTGINPRPYPLPPIPVRDWASLPTTAGMAALCDVLLVVPSQITAHIQEMHITLGHLLCGALEQGLGLVEVD